MAFSKFEEGADISKSTFTLGEKKRTQLALRNLKLNIKTMLSTEVRESNEQKAGIPSSLQLSTSPEECTGYPEGGWKAWSVVFGAWCAMIPSMGLLNTLGVLHAWISTHQLKDYSESSIGWIFGAYGFFLYFAGAQAGKPRSYQCRDRVENKSPN